MSQTAAFFRPVRSPLPSRDSHLPGGLTAETEAPLRHEACRGKRKPKRRKSPAAISPPPTGSPLNVRPGLAVTSKRKLLIHLQGRWPIAWIFAQHPEQKRFELCGDLPIERRRRIWFCVCDRMCCVDRRGRPKRMRARCQLVQHQPEREHIACAGCAFAASLLGRHVVESSAEPG